MFENWKKDGLFLLLLILALVFWGTSMVRRYGENTDGEAEETGALPVKNMEVQAYDVKDTTIPPIVTEADFSEEFSGHVGTAVFYCPDYNQYYIYRPDRSVVRMPPEQTFHLTAALIFMDQGLQLPSGRITWQEALKTSSDWYFEEALGQVKAEQIEQTLDALGYGNCEIGNADKDFWNDGTLKISAEEQVVLLSRILGEETAFRPEDVKALRDSLLQETLGDCQVAGIGGAGEQAAWYLGTMTDAAAEWYFTVRIDNGQGQWADASTAAAAAAQIILTEAALFQI